MVRKKREKREVMMRKRDVEERDVERREKKKKAKKGG